SRDGGRPSSPGVAGPGADDAFLAAEFVALLGGGIERGGNFWLHRIAVRATRVLQVNRQRRAGALHGDGRALAFALLQRGDARRVLARIIIGLAIGAALADRERAGSPGLRDEARGSQQQGERQNEQRTPLRLRYRNDQNPLPQGKPGANLRRG